jgi:DNA-directed RNA polymerase beta' subunit
MDNINIPKSCKLFCCDSCSYDTYSKKDFSKHIQTGKHLRLTNPIIHPFFEKDIYKCICNKKYKHMSSLCKHKKHCDINNLTKKEEENENIFSLLNEQKRETKEIKDLLFKQNQMIESLIKNNKQFSFPQFQNEFPDHYTSL